MSGTTSGTNNMLFGMTGSWRHDVRLNYGPSIAMSGLTNKWFHYVWMTNGQNLAFTKTEYCLTGFTIRRINYGASLLQVSWYKF